ncbi:SLP adapter and CSK-interacting membrane protein [Danio rerio]|uniref:SLP adapter and CSK-interacting membrane protein n=2 Tax=Danio rerio TaxID=7955 RepID=A0AB32TXG6_DANRE
MDFLQKNFWAVLILAIILVSVIIVIIFIFINICLRRRASWYSTQAKTNHYGHSDSKPVDNQAHNKDLGNEKPPLPPRDQFLSTNSVGASYEDIPTVPDYVEIEDSTPAFPQQPVFIPEYAVEIKSQDEESEDYDDVENPDDSEDYDDVG